MAQVLGNSPQPWPIGAPAGLAIPVDGCVVPVRYGHHRSLFRVLAAARHQGMAPAAEIRISAKVSQRVMGAVNQEPPQEMIARLGDGQLRPTCSGIIAPRPSEAEFIDSAVA